MKKTVYSIMILVFVLNAAACIFAPEEELSHDNAADPLNPDYRFTVTVNISGADSGEGLTSSAEDMMNGTEVTLTASLNSSLHRMISLNAEGASLSSDSILIDGGTATFTLDGSNVVISAEFSDRNIEKIVHADDAAVDDYFGNAVSIDGNYAVIGAPSEDGGDDDLYEDAGAAYLFKNNNGSWEQVEIIHAGDKTAGDYFGREVSLSGNYAIIGAPDEDGGDENLYEDAGAAYIFAKVEGSETWSQASILHADEIEAGESFGCSVDIDGDYAIVGACNEDGGGGYSSAGAAYIFKKDTGSSSWSLVDVLHSDPLEAGDHFGWSVGISGDYAVIGAVMEDGGSGNPVTWAGAAYIFKNDGSDNWVQVDILHASDLYDSDYLGWSVSIDTDRVIVGAIYENGGSSGLSDAGAAYIFQNDGSDNWDEKAILHASNLGDSDYFGDSVSISGDYAIVGAYYEDGEDNDDYHAGAAYLFKKDESADTWSEVSILRGSDAQDGDWFGTSVCISGEYAIAGAHGEDGDSDLKSCSGAAYIINNVVY